MRLPWAGRRTSSRPPRIVTVMVRAAFHEQQEPAPTNRVAATGPVFDRPNSLFQTICESLTDGILIWDRDGNYLYANQAALDYVGVTREQGIGRNIREVLAHRPELMETWVGRVQEAVGTGQPRRFEDTLTVAGWPLQAESRVLPLRNRDGHTVAVAAVYHDVTERRQAQARLNGLAKFPDENPNPVLRISRQGCMLYHNRASDALLAVWECADGEPVGPPWSDLAQKAFHSGRPQLVAICDLPGCRNHAANRLA